MEKYQFVTDHAPRMWLCEDDEGGWWPGTRQEFFDNTTAAKDSSHQIRLTTRIPLTGPYDRSQAFIHGQKPVDGMVETVPAFIWPRNFVDSEMDPLEMYLNPEDCEIEADYMYWMPYDWVKYMLDNHIGDIEHTHVYFNKGEPTDVYASYHASDQTKPWDKVEHYGDHPVVYNARGTHATYFQDGRIPGFELDKTCRAARWDFWKQLDVIFPWDF